MKYSLFTLNFEMKALAAKIVAFLAVIQLLRPNKQFSFIQNLSVMY